MKTRVLRRGSVKGAYSPSSNHPFYGWHRWIAASGAGHRVCASKRRTKGLRGAKRKPRRRCSEGKEKFRLRVCASKRRTKGLRGAERKPRRRCSGKKGKLRLRVCASKRRIKGLRGAERKPRRQEKSRRLSLVSGGSGDGTYASFNFGCPGKL